jgi:hypothetical protein
MNTEPYRITIESHGSKYTSELAWDANVEDIAEALRGMLIAGGFNPETVLKYLPMKE